MGRTPAKTLNKASVATWRRLGGVLFLALLCATPGHTSADRPSPVEQTPPERGFAPVDEIVVVGERRGPRLWRIKKGDAETFVLVTVEFVPEELDFDDGQIRAVLEETIEVLVEPKADFGAGDRARLVGTALRTLIFNRRRLYMPKAVTMADKVGPDLASAFDRERARQAVIAETLKTERKRRRKMDEPPAAADLSLPPPDADEDALERRLEKIDQKRLHPFFQAQSLFGATQDNAGLAPFGAIGERVEKLARRVERRPKPDVRPIVEIDVAYSDLKNVLKSVKDFSNQTNRACVAEAVEASGAGYAAERRLAEAWARGDVAYLTATSARAREIGPCAAAVSDELGGLKTFGGRALAELDLADLWAREIAAAMSAPGVRLALVPANPWLRPDGARERLLALGFEVIGPGGPAAPGD